MDEELVIAMDYMDAMRALCTVNDGDCALLYAYAAASGGHCRLTDAALHTGFDDRRMDRARSLLILYKICRMAGHHADLTSEGGYSPAELLEARRTDPAFAGICSYLEQAMNRPSLRKSEYEVLYSIYDRLNMPADVIMLLINYCKSKGRLSARELERRACEWHDKGVTTYTAAADLADEMDKRSQERRRILSLLGITGRSPSETEGKYIAAWQAMGMDDELIRLAYDRTVVRTGRLTWKYLHKILEDWHNKGYKTRAQVERAEGVAEAPQKHQPAAPVESVTTVVARRFEEKRQMREAEQRRRLEEVRKDQDFSENEVALSRLTIEKARAGLSGLPVDQAAWEARRLALQNRRADILRRMGKPEDYLALPIDCPKCGDRGYIGNRMCECFKRECIREEQARKEMMM